MKTRQVILIFGKTGTGKSFLASKLVKEYDRKIIIDTQGEYTDGIIFYDYKTLRSFIVHHYNYSSSFTYILRFDDDDELDKAFAVFYELENYVLLLEEAELYISPFTKKHLFLKLVRYGRHKKISLIGVARRVSELSADFQAQVDTVYTFKQTTPLDIKKMREMGIVGVEKLGKYSYIRKDF